MLTFKEFKESINCLNKINKFNDDFYKNYKINVSETDAIQESWKLFNTFIDSHFTESGKDLVYWWIYENVPKIIYNNTVFGKEKINIENIEDFWKYLESDKKLYFK